LRFSRFKILTAKVAKFFAKDAKKIPNLAGQ
jgi:hypothetical protein